MKPTNKTVLTSSTDDGVVYDSSCRLVAVRVWKAQAGKKLELFDDATATSPTGKFDEISLAAVGTFDCFSATCRKGLVAITDATDTGVTLIWA